MKKQFLKVAEFHEAFGLDIEESFTNVSPKLADLRHRLMAEENDEYLEACKSNNMEEIADALGDMLYILLGTALVHGFQDKMEEVFDAIQASNMSKLGADGKPIYREDGKVMKGPHYFKPDIKSVISSN